MPRRAPRIDPELKAHQEWLGYLQPRGLVVAPAAMQEAGWVLEQGGRELIEQQEQFREALQPLHPDPDDADDGGEADQVLGFRQLDELLVVQLYWDPEAIQREPAVLEAWTRDLQELGETLAPSEEGMPVELGLLFNGAQLRLVDVIQASRGYQAVVSEELAGSGAGRPVGVAAWLPTRWDWTQWPPRGSIRHGSRTATAIRRWFSERANDNLEGSEENRQPRRLDDMTSKRQGCGMDETKRATVYFDADVHRALRLRAAACNRSTSDMVNEAVRITLAEDADDLRDTDQREGEQSIGFEELVTSLRDSGRIQSDDQAFSCQGIARCIGQGDVISID